MQYMQYYARISLQEHVLSFLHRPCSSYSGSRRSSMLGSLFSPLVLPVKCFYWTHLFFSESVMLVLMEGGGWRVGGQGECSHELNICVLYLLLLLKQRDFCDECPPPSYRWWSQPLWLLTRWWVFWVGHLKWMQWVERMHHLFLVGILQINTWHVVYLSYLNNGHVWNVCCALCCYCPLSDWLIDCMASF